MPHASRGAFFFTVEIFKRLVSHHGLNLESTETASLPVTVDGSRRREAKNGAPSALVGR
jgi:hypothetical protein